MDLFLEDLCVNKFDNILNTIYEFSVIDERHPKAGFVFFKGEVFIIIRSNPWVVNNGSILIDFLNGLVGFWVVTLIGTV